MVAIVTLALELFWRFGENTWQALWVERWAIIIISVSVYFIFKLRVDKISKLALSYILINAVYSSFFQSAHPMFKEDAHMVLQHQSLRSLCALFAFIFFIHLKPRLLWIKTLLVVSALIVILSILFSTDSTTYTPVMSNPSMAATFCVLALLTYDIRMWPLCVIPIYFTHSACAAASLSVAMAFSRSYTRIIGIIASISGILYLFIHPKEWNGRIEAYALSLDYFKTLKFSDQAFGLGFGTTPVWLPALQLRASGWTQANVFTWMHSDWIQILMELGILGLVLCVLVAISALWKSRFNVTTRCAIAAFITAMAINMPIHWPMTAIVGWILLKHLDETTNHV